MVILLSITWLIIIVAYVGMQYKIEVMRKDIRRLKRLQRMAYIDYTRYDAGKDFEEGEPE